MRRSALKPLTVSGLVFLAGICIGAAVICLVPEALCAAVVSSVVHAAEGGGRRIDVALKFFSGAVRPVVLIWIFGFTRFSLYASCAAVGYRGGILGAVAGGLYRSFGIGKGLCMCLAGILPQNFIYIFILFFTAALSYEFSFFGSKTAKSAAAYFCSLIACIAACFLCGLADAYITYFFLSKGV